MPSPAIIVPSRVNRFPNNLAPNVHNNIMRNRPLCYFALFLIFLTRLINKPDSWTDLAIFVISCISSLEAINVVPPDPNIFLWIAASVADAAAINPMVWKLF